MRLFIFALAVLSSGLVFGSGAPSKCKDAGAPLSLRENMHCMGYYIDDAFADLGRPDRQKSAADNLREVRRHAQLALALVPQRFERLKAEESRIKALEYQIQLSKTLAALGTLELRLLTRPQTGDTAGSDPITAQMVMRLQQLIGEGHQNFR